MTDVFQVWEHTFTTGEFNGGYSTQVQTLPHLLFKAEKLAQQEADRLNTGRSPVRTDAGLSKQSPPALPFFVRKLHVLDALDYADLIAQRALERAQLEERYIDQLKQQLNEAEGRRSA